MPGAALATSAIGSFVAGTIATVLVTLFAPVVAEFAVKLGPPEYFMLMLLAFTTVSAVLGQSTVRGLTALFVGLALGLVGMDQITGQARYTGGVPELLDGIEIVLVAVGLFAVAEALHAVLFEGKVVESENQHEPGDHDPRRLAPLDSGLAARHRHRRAVRLHSGGRHRDPDLPELRHREEAGQGEHQAEFGTTGAIEGVAGPEAANNATVTAALIPLLTLGIPDVQHHGDLARRVPELRHSAGAAAVQQLFGAGVGADCIPVHRQRDAAGAEPAAGRLVGQVAQGAQAPALRRHPDFRDGRCLWHAPERLRPVPAVWHRAAGAGDAPFQLSRQRRYSWA